MYTAPKFGCCGKAADDLATSRAAVAARLEALDAEQAYQVYERAVHCPYSQLVRVSDAAHFAAFACGIAC